MSHFFLAQVQQPSPKPSETQPSPSGSGRVRPLQPEFAPDMFVAGIIATCIAATIVNAFFRWRDKRGKEKDRLVALEKQEESLTKDVENLNKRLDEKIEEVRKDIKNLSDSLHQTIASNHQETATAIAGLGQLLVQRIETAQAAVKQDIEKLSVENKGEFKNLQTQLGTVNGSLSKLESNLEKTSEKIGEKFEKTSEKIGEKLEKTAEKLTVTAKEEVAGVKEEINKALQELKDLGKEQMEAVSTQLKADINAQVIEVLEPELELVVYKNLLNEVLEVVLVDEDVKTAPLKSLDKVRQAVARAGRATRIDPMHKRKK